jgi:hypothetical protein
MFVSFPVKGMDHFSIDPTSAFIEVRGEVFK